MRRIAVAVLGWSVSGMLLAQTTPVFEGKRMSEDVKQLASDAFQGRAPGSAGEQKTIAYLSEQFAAAGLQPAGDAGRWQASMDADGTAAAYGNPRSPASVARCCG